METKFNPEQKTLLDDLLLTIPGVKGGKAFGYPAYKVGGRVFAFVAGKGVAIKLPEEKVKALIGAHEDMHPFEPGEGVIWREWVSIRHTLTDDFRQDIGLFEESIQFVAG